MMMPSKKKIHLIYYAIFKDIRGLSEETVETVSLTVQELYDELQKKYELSFACGALKVAVNDNFASWKTELKEGDCVIFIPPVSGG